MCDQEAGLHACICVLATEKFLVLHPHPEKQETRELMSFSRWLMKSKIPSSSSACYPLVIQAAFKQLYLNNPPKIKICSQSPSHKVFSRALPIVFWRPYTSPSSSPSLTGVHLLRPACRSSGNLTSLLSRLEMSLSCRFLDRDACVCFPVQEEGVSPLNFAPVP